MSEDMSNLLVLLDKTDSQQLSLPPDLGSLVATDESLQAVYVTSLLLVEPSPVDSKKKRIEQVVGDDFKVEDRLQVLDAMLPPLPGRIRKSKLLDSINDGEGSVSEYKCELCGCDFEQAEQYFGHLQTHSGEHLWECTICPSSQAVFETLSKLRQHEKLKHVNSHPNPHQCSLCPASYERVSQLESHHRRAHIEEKSHMCGLCGKGFYKRSDLRTHLGVHLGLQSRVCEICGRSFSHVSNLIRHARVHTGVKPYPCPTCGRRFTQLSALEEHRLTHLSGRPAFPCPAGLCSRDFRSRQIAARHARRLHPEAEVTDDTWQVKVKHQRRYHCAVCGETFEKANLLHLHESEHQDYTCSSCNETFLAIADLKSHGCSGQVSQLVEDTANLEFNNQIPGDVDLTEEMSGDVNSTLVENLPGEAEVQDVNATLESFLISGILVCAEDGTLKIASGEEFSSDCLLQLATEGAVALSAENMGEAQTVVDEPPGGSEIPPVTEPSSLYLSPPKGCSDFSFSEYEPTQGQSSLSPPPSSSSPLASSSLPSSTLPPPPSSPVMNGPSVKTNCDKAVIPRLRRAPVPNTTRKRSSGGTCSECGKHFRKMANLKQHMGIHFADKQLHRCDICSHTFAWKSSLNKHLVRHFPELPAAPKAFCHDCGKEYLTLAQVHEHLRRDHLLERSHVCELCSKAFYKKHDLATHMRIHTKEKPYMCGTCGKTFTHVSHMKRHELIHRGLKRYECDSCKARFRQSSGLKAHFRRHHARSAPTEIIQEVCALVDSINES